MRWFLAIVVAALACAAPAAAQYADDGGNGLPDCNDFTIGWHATDAYGREYECQYREYGDRWIRVGWDGN